MRKKIGTGLESKFNILSMTRFYKNLKRNFPKLQSPRIKISNSLNLKFSKKKTKIPKFQQVNLLRGKRIIKKNDQRFLNY